MERKVLQLKISKRQRLKNALKGYYSATMEGNCRPFPKYSCGNVRGSDSISRSLVSEHGNDGINSGSCGASVTMQSSVTNVLSRVFNESKSKFLFAFIGNFCTKFGLQRKVIDLIGNIWVWLQTVWSLGITWVCGQKNLLLLICFLLPEIICLFNANVLLMTFIYHLAFVIAFSIALILNNVKDNCKLFSPYVFDTDKSQQVQTILASATARFNRLPKFDSSKLAKKKAILVLSLDGGGVRGLVLAEILKRIQHEFPEFLENVDIIAGCSTGGMVASLLSVGFSPDEICTTFKLAAPIVFRKTLFDRLSSVVFRGCSHLHDSDGKMEVFESAFGNLRLGDCKKGLLIAASHLEDQLLDNGHQKVRCVPRIWTNTVQENVMKHFYSGHFTLEDRMVDFRTLDSRSSSSVSTKASFRSYFERIKLKLHKRKGKSLISRNRGSSTSSESTLCSSSGSESSLNSATTGLTCSQSQLPSAILSDECSPLRYQLKDIVNATTAAPLYFPSHQNHLDGGLWGNNPSMAAISTLLGSDSPISTTASDYPDRLHNIYMLSIATGTANRSSHRNQKQVNVDSISYWISHGIDHLMTSTSVAAHFNSKALLNDRYFRLDYSMDKWVDLNDVSALDYLSDFAQSIDLADTFSFLERLGLKRRLA